MKNDGALYLLQDGTYADPGECSAGKDGVLRHNNGVAVATRADGEPMTMASNTSESGNVEAAKAGRANIRPDEGASATPLTTAEIQPAAPADAGAPKKAAIRSAAAKPKAKRAAYKDREMKRR